MRVHVEYWGGVILVGSLLALPLGAQAVDRITGSDMMAAANESMGSGSRGGAFRLSRDTHAQYLLNRRTEASSIELHCAWDDILMVRSGVGVAHHGNKLKGLTRYGSREWRATEIVTPSETPLLPGDVVRIPAGQAHRITPLGDAPLVYLVIKVRSFEELACGSLPRRGA